MFKVLNTQTHQEIIILDPEWQVKIDQLRRWDHDDILVCQGCQQPMRVRAGRVRTWHFAHKHLANCPYSHESPQALQARAMLYRWLKSKFGEAVTLEKQFKGLDLPHPIDCWVKTQRGTFAYWIIESRLKPDLRDHLQESLGQFTPHWIFLSSMLREDHEQESYVHLTTTEREFTRKAKYDAMYGLGYSTGSLHYLDIETAMLTTYRALRLIHKPQLYAGHKETHLLGEMKVSGQNGELVHPGEHEKLVAYEGEQKRLAEERRKQQQLLEKMQQQRWQHRPQQPRQRPRKEPRQRSKPRLDGRFETSRPKSEQKPEGICETCGKKTRNWWKYSFADNTCRCYDCLEKA